MHYQRRTGKVNFEIFPRVQPKNERLEAVEKLRCENCDCGEHHLHFFFSPEKQLERIVCAECGHVMNRTTSDQEMERAMGITEMEREQDKVTEYGTKDEYGGL